jgi:hypothetical protein
MIKDAPRTTDSNLKNQSENYKYEVAREARRAQSEDIAPKVPKNLQNERTIEQWRKDADV